MNPPPDKLAALVAARVPIDPPYTIPHLSAGVAAGENLRRARANMDQAMHHVGQMHACLGTAQKFALTPSVNNLEVAFENASAAQAALHDADLLRGAAGFKRADIRRRAAAIPLSRP